MINERPAIKPDSRYSICKAAKVLGINRVTLYRWVENRMIKCTFAKVSRRKVFTGAELLRCWEQYI